MKRKIEDHIKLDLDKKIVLLSGPRQVGKTTLSKRIFQDFEYLNFDYPDDRKIIMNGNWKRSTALVVFDELHKKTKWKSWIKGIFDVEGVRPRIFVTGSAKLDIYRKGGDSLAGRHFSYRLHPFTVNELKDEMSPSEVLNRLLHIGGFPEPFLNGTEEFAKRWRRTHLDRILKEDLLELENVRNLKLLEILVDLLAERVGSPVSYNSLAKDLEISPHTVKKWIGILESLYVIFIVHPYSKNLARAIQKEPKIYFYDTGRIKNDLSVRLENVVACALLANLQYGQDVRGEKSELFYVRDKEKREVDFLTVIDKSLCDLVEVKLSDSSFSPSLNYFSERLKPQRSIQVVLDLNRERQNQNLHLMKSEKYLASLV